MSGEAMWAEGWAAAVDEAAAAEAVYDDARRWLAERLDGRSAKPPLPPIGVEVWAFEPTATRVLLVRHRWRGWVPPGGKVESGETPRAAAERELAEETGLRVAVRPFPAAVCVRSYTRQWAPTLGLSYVAIVDAGLPLVAERGQPVAWTALDDGWASAFPDDPERIRAHAARLPRPPRKR